MHNSYDKLIVPGILFYVPGTNFGQQVAAPGFDNIQDFREAGGAAVVGGGHVTSARIGVSGEEQPHLGAGVFGAQRFEVGEMAAVHGEDQIKAGKVGGRNLARAQAAEIDVARLRGSNAARIRWFTDVIAVRASGIGLDVGAQPLYLHQRPEDTLGGRRAADVSRAEEQYFHLLPLRRRVLP